MATVYCNDPCCMHSTCIDYKARAEGGESCRPYWIDRPRNMAPLWVDPDVVDVIQWARTLPERKTSSRNFKAMEFSPAEAMQHFVGGEHGSKENAEWWARVQEEGRAANMLAEVGYFSYRITSLALLYVPENQGPPTAADVLTPIA